MEKEKKFRILLLNGGEVQKVIETDSEREAGDIWREGYESEGYAAVVYLMGVKLTLRECMEVFGTEAAIDYRRRSGR